MWGKVQEGQVQDLIILLFSGEWSWDLPKVEMQEAR